MHPTNIAFLFLVATVAWFELLAPHTKVEESFNMQAIHDFLYAANSTDEFDHLQFPGVVPRSFLPSLLVAGLVAPFAVVLRPLTMQHVCRLVIGAMFLAAIRFVGAALEPPTCKRKKGPTGAGTGSQADSSSTSDAAADATTTKDATASTIELWYYLLVASQFHLSFYATRTLPNSFALILVTAAFGLLLRHAYYPALAVLGATATVIRCDIFILVAPLTLLLLITGRVRFLKGLAVGVASCATALAMTVPLDSFLWRRLLWPEGDVLFFNTVLNKSHEWGTLPFHSYFTSILPRAFLLCYPLVLYAAGANRHLRLTSISALLFCVLYSFLPHKELRFLLPVFPLLLAPVAVVVSVIAGRHRPDARRSVMCLAVLGLHAYVAFSFAWVSSYNYPGAEALQSVHDRVLAQALTATPANGRGSSGSVYCPASVRIFVDDYAAMSGINRFQQLQGPVQLAFFCRGTTIFHYEKNQQFFNASAAASLREGVAAYGDPAWPFDYIIVRASDLAWHASMGQYKLLRRVQQLAGVSWARMPPQMLFSEYLVVMKKE